MRIISKFFGKCRECGEAIAKGSEIEFVNKAAFHPTCYKEEERDYARLATELGFVTSEEAQRVEWSLWYMPATPDQSAAGRDGPNASGRHSLLWDEEG